ncbi:MAG TPA: hypothetical protein VIY73_21750 [Polyangiaceae bacterium]
MANHTSDRQRMRNDLRELAKLAAPSAPATPHGFDSADSSGYVDLSAFSARDPAWVDRELARAKRGALPPPLPGSKRIDALSPASMSPVALESFVLADDTASVRPSRGRRFLVGVGALAGVGLVAFLAVTLARHPPPAAAIPPTTAAAAPSPSPAAPATPATETVAAAAPAPSAPAPAGQATTTPDTAPATSTAASTSPSSSSSKKKHASHRFHGAPAAAPSPVVAAAAEKKPAAVRAAVIPASRPTAGGNDSLMDLIKKSVASGK